MTPPGTSLTSNRNILEGWKSLSTSTDRKGASRKFYALLLWYAFPGPSQEHVARSAARVLGKSERAIRNHLHCLHDPSASDFLTVLMVAGAEVVFQGVENEQGRKGIDAHSNEVGGDPR